MRCKIERGWLRIFFTRHENIIRGIENWQTGLVASIDLSILLLSAFVIVSLAFEEGDNTQKIPMGSLKTLNIHRWKKLTKRTSLLGLPKTFSTSHWMNAIRNKKKLFDWLTSFSCYKKGKDRKPKLQETWSSKKKLAKNDNWCFSQLQFSTRFPLQITN